MENTQIGDWLIYKNNQLVAFNKPSGMLTQGDKSEEKSLLDVAEIYSKSKLHLLHRLDRPASGIVLLAKTSRSIQSLSQQFQHRTVQKTYLAIVKNKPPKDKDTLTHYLKRHAKSRKSLVVQKEDAEAQEAILQYEVIGKSDNYNLLKIELLQGVFRSMYIKRACI